MNFNLNFNDSKDNLLNIKYGTKIKISSSTLNFNDSNDNLLNIKYGTKIKISSTTLTTTTSCSFGHQLVVHPGDNTRLKEPSKGHEMNR